MTVMIAKDVLSKTKTICLFLRFAFPGFVNVCILYVFPYVLQIIHHNDSNKPLKFTANKYTNIAAKDILSLSVSKSPPNNRAGITSVVVARKVCVTQASYYYY